MGKRKNGMFRIKVEYEDTPILDEKVRGEDGLSKTLRRLRMKF